MEADGEDHPDSRVLYHQFQDVLLQLKLEFHAELPNIVTCDSWFCLAVNGNCDKKEIILCTEITYVFKDSSWK